MDIFLENLVVKQTNKQTNKKTNKRTNKQRNKTIYDSLFSVVLASLQSKMHHAYKLLVMVVIEDKWRRRNFNWQIVSGVDLNIVPDDFPAEV